MMGPLVELGGAGPTLLLALANGFPPPAYLPLLSCLSDRHRVVCLPPRALWPGGGQPPEAAGSWESVAQDLVDGIRTHRLEPVIGVGHSFGAVALVLAATDHPDLFRGLALLDPTIFLPERMDRIAADRAGGREARFELSRTALRRRRYFTSIEEATRYFSGRPLFRDWPGETVRQYAAAVLEPLEDRPGLRLAWSPEWESWYYRSFYPGTWNHVERLDPVLPVLVIGGSDSDTFTPEAAGLLARRLPRGTHVTVPGAGHLFPLSHAAATGRHLTEWLVRIPSG